MKNKAFISKPKGFTLIEFMVASSLAIIVIMAAGGTYFLTRQLTTKTQARLDVQQNLRNASSMLTRDARNAGTFGCFNTAVKAGFPNVSSPAPAVLNKASNDGFGVRLIEQANIAALGGPFNKFTPQSDMVVFIYGRGYTGVTQALAGLTDPTAVSSLTISNAENDPDLNQAFAKNGDVVISSCKQAVLAKLDAVSNPGATTLKFKPDIDLLEMKDETSESRGEIGVSRLYASAYVLGTVDGSAAPALLRFELGSNSQWQESPQLLAEGINDMDVSFGYVNNCNNLTATNASQLNKETFSFANKPNQEMLPALVRLHLKYHTDASIKQAHAKGEAINATTADYFINATVRGGNTCATVTPSI